MTTQRPAAIACLRASISGWKSAVLAADGMTVLAAAVPSDDRAAALGEAASGLVERFAPDAPSAIKSESVIRVVAWLHAREPKPVQAISLDSIRLDFRERFFAPAAMTNSGARSLLMPWRLRRALPVEDTGA